MESSIPSHQPVLLEEVVQLLNPQPGETYFDGTAGLGGHAAAILERIGEHGRAIVADRDGSAIGALRQRFGDTAEIWHTDMAAAAERLLAEGIDPDMVLLDLGVSSPQLDQPERGFSFLREGPLDMRMDGRAETTAAGLVNSLPERELADLIYAYGEERYSRRIAKAIVGARPLTTTAELASTVSRVVPHRRHEIHPATRTFQALRIAVNEELMQLEVALPRLIKALRPGGRIAVISFHSLEDRIVKETFRRESRDCICPANQPVCSCRHVATLSLLTRKPLTGKTDAFNPRARSAKLRAACKLKPKEVQ